MQVLERILAVDFRFPASIPVSADCKNLLSRILVADPAKRASIEEIQQHPWCALAAHAPLPHAAPEARHFAPDL